MLLTGMLRWSVWSNIRRASNKGVEGNLKGDGSLLGSKYNIGHCYYRYKTAKTKHRVLLLFTKTNCSILPSYMLIIFQLSLYFVSFPFLLFCIVILLPSSMLCNCEVLIDKPVLLFIRYHEEKGKHEEKADCYMLQNR